MYIILNPLLLVLLLQLKHSNCQNLLTSYLPASMQALAYYIDQLQYEPLSTTTVEPPFSTELDPSFTTSTTTTTTTPRTSTINDGWTPPSWWPNSDRLTTRTTPKTSQKPTAPHRPALYAPPTPRHRPALYAPPNNRKEQQTQSVKLEGYEIFREIDKDDGEFDKLPLSLIRDIQSEINLDDFTNDVESLDNFLRLYDDNYGRATLDYANAMDRWSSTSTAGKKRVPPTKPYVDFLLVYDLLKRDAKATNLSKYEGYTDELLQDLYELSHASAERQLFTLFTRMLKRGDIQRSDVVARIQGIVRDLANPNSATSKALRYIPALQFIP